MSTKLDQFKLRKSNSLIFGKIEVGNDKIIFRQGLAVFNTVPDALKYLHQLHRRATGHKDMKTQRICALEPWQASILHKRAEACALATLQVCSRPARIALSATIFDFVHITKLSEGLESVILSAIVAVKDDEPRLAEAGLTIWRQVTSNISKKVIKSNIPVIDVNKAQISFLSPEQITSLTERITVAGQIGSYLPGFGTDASSDPSNQKCTPTTTYVATVLGAIGGAGFGILPGVQTGAGSGPFNPLGGGVWGASWGALVGGLGAYLASPNASPEFCTNAGPEAPFEEDPGYNAGFEEGWRSATGQGKGSQGSSGTQFDQGFADGYAAGYQTTQPVKNDDGSETTFMNDGTTQTVYQDGTISTTMNDGTTSTNNADGSITTTNPGGETVTISANRETTTTTSADGKTTTTTSSGGTTTTTKNDDGSTTTTTPDDNTTTTPAKQDTSTPDNKDNDFPNPEEYVGGGPVGPAVTVLIKAFPIGAGLQNLITTVTVGKSHTYYIAALPQLAVGGGLASAGILAGIGQ